MLVVILFALGIIFTGLLRNAFVQTYLARITAIHLSEYLDTQVKIDRLRVSAFFTLDVEGVEINDLQNKPLIYFKSLYLSTDIFKVLHSDFALNKLEIDSARVFVKKYIGKDDLNIVNIINKFKRSESQRIDSLSQASNFIVKVNSLSILNSRFLYQIEADSSSKNFGVNYSDLDVEDIDIILKNIRIHNDSINGQIKHLALSEKSGFRLDHFEGDLNLSNQGMVFQFGLFETPLSNLEFNLSFLYSDWKAYADFIDEIQLKGEILNGQMNSSDISFFAPELEGMDNYFKFKGTFDGPIRNLRLRDILLDIGQETTFSGNIQLTGLPKLLETFISLRIRDFSTSIRDIQAFKLPGGSLIEQLPETVKSLGKINVVGNFTGFYNDFVSNAKFKTNIGQLNTDIQFSNDSKRDIIEYSGDFQARKFDLGKFINQQDYFGKLDLNLKVKGEGLDLESINANVEGEINTFQFKNEQLDDILINGLFQERQFTGDISINDELIQADFQGHINFDTLVPVFDFNLKLAQTHIASLGLLSVDSSAVVSSNINLNFIGNTIDNINGEIKLDSTFLIYKNEAYEMKSFVIQTKTGEDTQRNIDIRSDFVDGEIDGMFQLSELGITAKSFLTKYLPNLFAKGELVQAEDNEIMNWDIRFKNFHKILPLFQKKLQISEDGRWIGHYDASSYAMNSMINLKNANYLGVQMNNLQLLINSDDQLLNTELLLGEMIFKEGDVNDTLVLSIDNLQFNTQAKEDSVKFALGWKNNYKPIQNKGTVDGFVSLSQTPNIDIKLTTADLIINDSTWIINRDNLFRIKENGLFFEKVGFYSGNQVLEVTGGIDKASDQVLSINFNQFDISNFDIIFNSNGLDMDGFIDGDLQLMNLLTNVDFLADLDINKLSINKESIGTVSIKSKRNLDKSIFVNAEIVKILEDQSIVKPLIFDGIYFPKRIENSLDFALKLNELPVQIVSPLLYKWTDNLSGTASGNVSIKGNTKSPNLAGSIKLKDVGFRIDYLNTKYTLNSTAIIDNNFIDFREADLRDEFNNQAVLYGGLFHNHLKDFGVDVSIWPRNFMGLDTNRGMNSLFYGKAFATGSVDINGPFDAVAMDIKLEANRGSHIVIPISLTSDISDNEFITFVNHADTLMEKQKKELKELSNFSLNMDLTLTPEARVDIILPEDLGNIQAEGYGDLNLNVNPAGIFTMAGDFQVSKGTFLFTIKNIYKKRFDLVDGGTISWTGDPYAGELNMKAIYHVKTTLSTLPNLTDDQKLMYSSRIPVDCVIGLKDLILNPTVKFGFEFPNSAESIRETVFNLIDTTNEAEMSQQMLSLLVLNSFSFSSNANDDFASSVGGSSLQLVANQLGNWLSQISNEVDVGIKYRPGSGELTNTELEVALSTQFLDDRITVETNFGTQNLDNPSSTSSSNTSDIVGDINVEYKITRDGRFRLKGFNRTNTFDIEGNTGPFTQGVGVFYRKEFNYFSDLFKRKKKKQKVEENKDAEEPKEDATTTVENPPKPDKKESNTSI